MPKTRGVKAIGGEPVVISSLGSQSLMLRIGKIGRGKPRYAYLTASQALRIASNIVRTVDELLKEEEE